MLSLLSLAVFIFSPANASISSFYFIDEFSRFPIERPFDSPCYIFVAMEENYETEGIYITAGNITKTLTELATTKNHNEYQAPAFDEPVSSIKIVNTSPHQPEKMAIIYAAKDMQNVITVTDEPIQVDLKDKITFLSPGGLVQVSDFGESRAPVIVTIGGVEETNSKEFTLHGLGSAFEEKNPPLLIFEPVLTIHKEYGPLVTFQVTGASGIRDKIEMNVDWGDRIVAMSNGYKLRNTSSSVSYEIKPTQNNTEFHVRLSGDIPEVSQLTFKDNELGGNSRMTIKGQNSLDEHELHFGGDYLEVEYQRGKEDTSGGFYALIEKLRLHFHSLSLSWFLSLFDAFYNKPTFDLPSIICNGRSSASTHRTMASGAASTSQFKYTVVRRMALIILSTGIRKRGACADL